MDYEPQYHKVMEWAFGDTFVCVDNDTAKEIAFNKNMRIFKKSVTLDGDSYDPSGIVSGGRYLGVRCHKKAIFS